MNPFAVLFLRYYPQRVVDAVLEHMIKHSDESLGVVTLNLSQRELIEEHILG